MIFPTWFDSLEESFSYKDVQFKKFCPPVKTSCLPAENVNQMKPPESTCTLHHSEDHIHVYNTFCLDNIDDIVPSFSDSFLFSYAYLPDNALTL